MLTTKRPSTMPPSVYFRFIRSSDAKAFEDDTSSVTRIDHDQFQLTFRYKDAQQASIVNKTILDSAGVLQWARRAIDMMEQDVEPFHQFQIDFPLLPSVIFNVNQIADNYHGILDALEFSLDNWPCLPEVKTPAPAPASAYDEDEDDDMDESESEADSLPPLIPVNSVSRPLTRSQTQSVSRHLFYDE